MPAPFTTTTTFVVVVVVIVVVVAAGRRRAAPFFSAATKRSAAIAPSTGVLLGGGGGIGGTAGAGLAYAATSEAVSVTLTGPDGQAREYASRPLPADLDRGFDLPVKDITEEVLAPRRRAREGTRPPADPTPTPTRVSESRQVKSSQAREAMGRERWNQ